MLGGERSGGVWGLPNILSLLRIAVAPLLILILISPPTKGMSILAALIFILASLTDWLDGYLARRMMVTTTLGKFLDPLADKLLIVTSLIMLIPLERAPAWMVALIVGREIAVTGLRGVASTAGLVIPASNLGKYKTAFQIAAVAGLLIHYPIFGIDTHSIGMTLLWIALFLTLWSGLDY
ncbi:MAG: CDP-diacylglycerol--glycerol-3-phosphate 3-phosphatidyltransferase, partial [Deltaproteobacteria bacterium]|nr:CDP-diacylglycerol--glycerol-3-phosphate 3-phosphatidyltransferase [Deltaproteobacteria bacterium]